MPWILVIYVRDADGLVFIELMTTLFPNRTFRKPYQRVNHTLADCAVRKDIVSIIGDLGSRLYLEKYV